jgi:hypothetical protein
MARDDFVSRQETYGRVINDHENELDLDDAITPERFDQQPFHAVVTTRRWLTDSVFPYNTTALNRWI